MSSVRCWFMFRENVPSTFSEKRLSRTLPFHERFERRVRCGVKPGATSVTFGAAVEKTEPVVPSAHVLGMPSRLCVYRSQFGNGPAGPTHTICCVPLGKPVFSSAPFTNPAELAFTK